MLKEFIQHIQQTTQPQITTIGDSTFAVNANGSVNEIRPIIDHPDTLDLHSLDALVKMVRTEATDTAAALYITIPNHLTVRCFGQPQPEARFFRQDLLPRISKESNVASNDNGVSQTVEARQGISLKATVQIKPRVPLRPFRTFQEVEQPESEFLLRLNEAGDVGLFEADGGMWKLRARETVKAFLENALEAEIAAGAVYIAL